VTLASLKLAAINGASSDLFLVFFFFFLFNGKYDYFHFHV
jgi:hypothetical protein